MATSGTCWGIEIGAAAIKAIKLEESAGGVNVLDYAVIPHQKLLSTPGVDANDVLRLSLGALTSQYDLSKSAIAVSVPGHAAFARFTKLPPVEPKKIPAIVKFEAVQQIPFPLDQVEWDYQTFVSPNSPDVEVGIFAITKERIAERLQMLKDVGITPDFVTLSPIAAYNALAFDLQFTETTPGTIILDIGTTSTDVVVAEAGRVWVRTFPIGGHQFTEALVNQFKLSHQKAEKLKCEAVDEGPNQRHVFQAMRSVFTDLAEDVKRSITYYQSLHREARLVRLIGVGSTFELPGLRKYLKQQLSMEIYRVEEFKRTTTTTLGDAARDADFKTKSLSLTTAYGCALQGLGLNAITANLMPVGVIREAMWGRKNKWFAAAAGVAVAAGGAMFLRPWMDSIAIAGAVKDPIIDQAARAASTAKSEANDAGVVGAGETDFRAANLVRLLDDRAIMAHVVDDLGQMLASAELAAPGWAAKNSLEAPKIPTGIPAGFALKKFTTSYLDTSGSTMDGSDASGGDLTEGQRVQRERQQKRLAESGAAEVVDPFAGRQRIRVNMQVTTLQPIAQRFAIATLDTWLRKNAKRDGVPFEIAIGDSLDWKVEEVVLESTPIEVAATGSSGDSRSGGYEAGGKSRGGREKMGDRLIGAPEASMEDTTSATGTAAGSVSQQLEQLAPLSTLKPFFGPGTKKSTVEVTFDLVLTPRGVKVEEANK